MAQGVRHQQRRGATGLVGDLKGHPRESALALATAGLGAVALVTCLVEDLHVLTSFVGAAGLVVGTASQLLSVNLTQRWITVLGWVASFIGLLVAMGHGGFTP
jgi:hypothetical protein